MISQIACELLAMKIKEAFGTKSGQGPLSMPPERKGHSGSRAKHGECLLNAFARASLSAA
jgi:hypothetical protein